MPKISKKRRGEIETLRPLVEVLNGERGWGALRAGFALVKALAAGWEYRSEEEQEIEYEDFVELPPDDDFKEAATWLRGKLIRWMSNIDEPEAADPEFPKHFERVYVDLLKRNPQLAKERLLGKPLRDDPLQRRLPRIDFFVNFVADPSCYAEAQAIRLFQLAYQNPDRVRKCQRDDCPIYFINGCGQQHYCCRRHAQAAVNEGREKEHDRKLTSARRAIAAWKPRSGPWKAWVGGRTGLTKNFLTYAVNAGRLTPPKEAERATTTSDLDPQPKRRNHAV